MATPPPALDSAHEQIAQGLCSQQASDWEAALGCFRQAALLDAGHAPAYLLMGNALSRMGRWDEACASYEHAVAIDPDYADAYNNLGIALQNAGREREAIAAHAHALQIEPRHAHAYFNLGKMCSRHQEFVAARQMLKMALSIEPQHPYAWHELGAVEERCGQLEKAAACYRRAMELDPTRTVRENLAAVLTLQGHREGLARQRQLLEEEPADPESHWNLGIGLLLHGEYPEGWREFEWRTRIPRYAKHHNRFPQPRWQGEALDGRTLLLYGEQGHGDTLQFLRYVPLAAARGAGQIVLDVPQLLKPLLKRFPGTAACTALADPKPAFDVYASLMSLPYLLDLEAIPPPLAPPVATSAMPEPATGRKLRVGLSWAGSPKQKRDRLRSIPLALWNRLAEIDGIEFTSLQMGPPNPHAPAAGHAFRFAADCADARDFAELASVVAGLDLVISIDTAVAHLAGSLGKPVWILLPNTMDWRWGLNGIVTPWYPTARLLRQSSPADWSTVIAEVARELAVLAGG